MKSKEELSRILRRIDNRGYKAYKDIEGVYDFGDHTLFIDHVQGDPFAAPSRIRVLVARSVSNIHGDLITTKVRRIAVEDYLTRKFHLAITDIVKGNRGIGKSGFIGIDHGGQEVLERSSMFVDSKGVEARFFMGLPARGRTILGREAGEMFFEEVPEIVRRSLLYKNLEPERLKRHVYVVEDQNYIRDRLKQRGLVAFVANDSVLPRRSGIDDRPLTVKKGGVYRGEETVIPFKSPEGMEVEEDTPNRGLVKGIGIKEGVTLIIGGGFHGKTTFLNALERGVYDHIPDDGRDYVVTIHDAVKIRAEDGRSVVNSDISPFIRNLPFGKDTDRFTTENASGSTSQAANIIESLEAGAKLLLIDEDTSATNFMIRDERMQDLVAKEKEPITPFIDKVRQLYHDYGVSTILVIGGAGDYLDVADKVIMMDEYRPGDVTDKAIEVVSTHVSKRKMEGGEHFGKIRDRIVLHESFNPGRGKREVKIDARGLKNILYGRTSIDLIALEQLVDIGQTRAIGDIIHYFSEKYSGKDITLREGLSAVIKDINEKGIDILSPFKLGSYALPRIYEVAAAINRMRTLKIRA
ncbi:MAG: ABC-ATPase domain-containing protein [Nitrospinota bacterium]